jgi:TetR/AcrR family transcriptional repressor of nem operon
LKASSAARPVPIRDAVAAFVDGLIERIVSGSGRAGCFIGNCAAELARRDWATAARVRRSLQRIEAVFRDALAGAQARGEIEQSANIDAIARFLVAGIQGLRLVGKAHPDRAVLDDIKTVMLRCI